MPGTIIGRAALVGTVALAAVLTGAFASSSAGPVPAGSFPESLLINEPAGSFTGPGQRSAGESTEDADPPSQEEVGSETPSSVLTTDAAAVARAVVHLQTEDRAGSGFVLSPGRVLTNEHVVGDATSVSVWFSNGARRIGTVIATDSEFDLALIEVPRIPRSVQPLDWESAESSPIGTPVWAWGYPLESSVVAAGFTRSPTVSAGIVSARRKRGDTWFLQTDAALNSGNSGGPIVTADGFVVAISTVILAPGGRDPEGLNFAVDLVAHRERVRALLTTETAQP